MPSFIIAVPELSRDDLAWIEALRVAHDAEIQALVPPHLTLVFATTRVGREELLAHARSATAETGPFECVFTRAVAVRDTLSTASHVFLVPDEGYDDVVRLHDRLYEGRLKPELRADIEYVPHITLARTASFELAERIVASLGPLQQPIRARVDRVEVVEIETGAVVSREVVLLGRRAEARMPSERERPYLLLDAGGTLVFPHAELLEEACRRHGCHLAPGAVFDGFFRLVRETDEILRQNGAPYPIAEFMTRVLESAGAPVDVARAAYAEATIQCGSRSLWTYALPWTDTALERLRAAGHRMAVVSNSDGTVRRQMSDLGLAHHFDAIFDSHELGVQKPDPRIFEAALAALGLAASECLYVGDVVMVDVAGANAAGIRAIHLDPLGLYEGWPGYHVKDLHAVADALVGGEWARNDPRLVPFVKA